MLEKISQEDYVKELFSAIVHIYSGKHLITPNKKYSVAIMKDYVNK